MLDVLGIKDCSNTNTKYEKVLNVYFRLFIHEI